MSLLTDTSAGGGEMKSFIQNPVVMLLLAVLAGGGTAIGYRHSPLSDPFPGKRGEAVEERLGKLEQYAEVMKVEHKFFLEKLSKLPPQDLLDDVMQLSQRIEKLQEQNTRMQIQLTKIELLLTAPQDRNHVSPNDLIKPGKYGGVRQ